MVVSHFDIDHWRGLATMARMRAAVGSLKELTLYYPVMPTELSPGMLAMMTLRQGTGVDALDLRTALRPIMQPGNHIEMRPLARGDKVDLAGATFRVLWPPARLDMVSQQWIHDTIIKIDDLANDLDREGHPSLRGNLALLRERPALTSDDIGDQQIAKLDARRMLGEEWRQSDIDDACPTSADEEPNGWIDEWADAEVPRPLPQESRLFEVPTGFLSRFQHLTRRIRRANNDLSLVLADEYGTLVCFGDAGMPVLTQIAEDLQTMYGKAMRPFMMLAPHHGTHPVPANMPTADVCVSQAGRRHHRAWINHLTSHQNQDRCINTFEVGTSTFQ
jgi:hypothetical protein